MKEFDEVHVAKQEKEYGGEITGFPKEVVEKMLDEQERQGNERDVSIFERNKTMNVGTGGFDWGESTDGMHFWDKVISDENFDTFFEKYPKSEKKVTYEVAPKPKFKVGDKAYNASIDPFSDPIMAAFGVILEKKSMQLEEQLRNKLWTTADVERWYYTAFGAKKGDNGTLILSSKSGVVEVNQDI